MTTSMITRNLLVFCFLIFTASEAMHTHYRCSPGYVLYQERERCFKVLFQENDFIGHQVSCMNDGGNLVRIPDEGTNNFVKELLTHGHKYIIGMQRSETGPAESYMWIDESFARYEAWKNGVPNSPPNKRVMLDESLLWVDVPLRDTGKAICEQDPIPLDSSAGNWYCPRTYLYYQDSNGVLSCIKAYSNTLATRDEAIEHCNNSGGGLLEVKHFAIIDFITNLLAGSNKYWVKNHYAHDDPALCLIVIISGTSGATRTRSCIKSFPFICQHAGYYVENGDLEKVTTIGGNTYYTTHGALPYSEFSSLCERNNLTDLTLDHFYIVDWMSGSPLWKERAEQDIWYKAHLDNPTLSEYSSCAASDDCCFTRNGTGSHDHVTVPCAESHFGICVKGSGYPNLCPIGYNYYKKTKKCYMVAETRGLKWEDANKRCANEGGNLVTIPDEETNNFIRGLLQPGHFTYWIGLRKDDSSEYTWVGNIPVTFGAFSPNEHDCVYYRVWLGNWFSGPCSTTYWYICEKDPIFFPACSTGQLAYGSGQKCVDIHTNNEVDWDTANSDCHDLGRELLTIPDQMTQDFVDETMSHISRFWIGLRCGPDMKYTHWIDGTAVTHTNYGAGQPQFFRPECIMVIPTEGGWHDVMCSVAGAWVCQQAMVTTYPGIECPRGHYTHISSSGWFTCIKVVVDNSVSSWTEARQRCQAADAGGDIFLYQEDQAELHDFVFSHLTGNGPYLISYEDTSVCQVYTKHEGNYVASPVPCRDTWTGQYAGYICQHTGILKYNLTLDLSKAWLAEHQVIYNGHQTNVCEAKYQYYEYELDCSSSQEDVSPESTANIILSYPKVYSDCQMDGLNPCCAATIVESVDLDKRIFKLHFPTNKMKCLCHEEKQATSQCPSGYTPYSEEKKCLKAYLCKKPFDDARKVCQQEGGDLVVIGTEAKSQFIRASQLTKRSPLWIGLRDSDDGEGIDYSRWIDGTERIFDRFYGQEPNGVTETCVRINTATDRYWVKDHCYRRASFICEYTLIEDDSQESLRCRDGYSPYSDPTRCVKAFHNESVSWFTAVNRCQEDGAELVSIEKEPMTDIITDLLTEPDDSYWIGLRESDPYRINVFDKWTNGETVNYTHWASTEPKMTLEKCFNLNWNNFWRDGSCMAKHNFICEQEQAPKYYLFECPDGFMTHVTKAGKVTCLKIVSKNDVSWGRAQTLCQVTGGYLFFYKESEVELQDYVISQLHRSRLAHQRDHWMASEAGDCMAYAMNQSPTPGNSYTPETSPCQMTLEGEVPSLGGYICEHPPMKEMKVQLLEFEAIDDLVSLNEESPMLVCDVTNMDSGSSPSSGRGTIRVRLDSNFKPGCINDDDGPECCVDAKVHFIDEDDYGMVALNIPTESIPCLCKPVSSSLFYESSSMSTMAWDLESSEIYIYPSTTVSIDAISDTFILGYPASTLEDISSLYVDLRSSTFGESLNSLQSETNLSPTVLTASQSSVFDPMSLDISPTVSSASHFTPTSSIPVNAEPLPPNDNTHEPSDPGTPVTTETVDYLKDLTKPKENSTEAPPNKLCPCQCRNTKIDMNPSPEALLEMVSKIQDQLRVDQTALASKRNKKISAKDDRTSSQSVGYVSLFLCAIPFGCLVAADILRIFQARDMKNT